MDIEVMVYGRPGPGGYDDDGPGHRTLLYHGLLPPELALGLLARVGAQNDAEELSGIQEGSFAILWSPILFNQHVSLELRNAVTAFAGGYEYAFRLYETDGRLSADPGVLLMGSAAVAAHELGLWVVENLERQDLIVDRLHSLTARAGLEHSTVNRRIIRLGSAIIVILWSTPSTRESARS